MNFTNFFLLLLGYLGTGAEIKTNFLDLYLVGAFLHIFVLCPNSLTLISCLQTDKSKFAFLRWSTQSLSKFIDALHELFNYFISDYIPLMMEKAYSYITN